MRTMPASILLLGLATLSAIPSPAVAGFRRCIDGNGVSVYTDRGCSELDAVARVGYDSHGELITDAAATQGGVPGAGVLTQFGVRGNGGMTPRGCARNPVSLLDGVRGALESGDVNRLAAYYHWSGVSQANARRLMTELETVTARPLVGASLAYPDPDPDEGEASLYEWSEGRDDEETTASPPTREPVALELQQMSGVDDAGARSVRFALHPHAGCWWIRF